MELDLSQLSKTLSLGAFLLIGIRVIIYKYKHIFYFLYILVRLFYAHFYAKIIKKHAFVERYKKFVKYNIKKDSSRADIAIRVLKFLKSLFIIEPQTDSNKFVVGAVYFVVIFAFGVLLEDLSKNVVSQRGWRIEVLDNYIFSPDLLVPPDEDTRVNSFFKVDRKAYGYSTLIKKMSHTGLSRDFYRISLLKRVADSLKLNYTKYYLINKFSNIEYKCDIKASDYIHVKECTRFISSIYYYAKNTVYRNENYFSELEFIASRIDFSRSFTLLNYYLFAFGAIMFGVQLVVEILYNIYFHSNWKGFLKSLAKSTIVLSIFFSLLWVGRTAYISEQTNYHLRVFGYFHSLCAPSTIK